MPRTSAGLLLYRRTGGTLEVLLVHPGGPFWKGKDEGAWTMPKGEVAEGEEPLATARREFVEETGQAVPAGALVQLQSIRQRGGKIVHAWAVEGDLDAAAIVSNTIRMEWPPKSGKFVAFPEVDRAGFFDLPTARVKMNPAQVAFLEELEGTSFRAV